MPSQEPNPVDTVTENLDTTLVRAFQGAYNNKHQRVSNELMNFVSSELIKAYSISSIPFARHLKLIPGRFLQCSLGNEYGSKEILETFNSSFNICHHFTKSSVESLESDEAILNGVLYEGIAQFYYQLIKIQKDEILDQGLEQFNRLREDHDFAASLSPERLYGATPEKVAAFVEDTELSGFRGLLHRRLSLSIQAWALYLYSIQRMDISRTKKIISGVGIYYSNPLDILSDAAYIRKFSHSGFLGINWWDYIERKPGVSYSPPSAYDWIVIGATYHLLDAQLTGFNYNDVPLDKDYVFLLEKIREYLERFENNWQFWREVIYPGSEAANGAEAEKVPEQFTAQKRSLLNILGRLKNQQQYQNDKKIVDQSLDEKKVGDFLRVVGQEWQRNNRILAFFDYFGNINRSEPIHELPQIGTKLRLNGFKMMFIDENYQQIHGSNQIGGEVARAIDGKFIQEIQFGPYEEIYETLKEGMTESILSLENEKFQASLIIIPPEFSYRTDLLSMAGFTRDDRSQGIEDFGTFLEVPVTTLYTPLLQDEVFVLDFFKAVELELHENKERLYNRLHVAISSLSQLQVEDIFQKEADALRKTGDAEELTDEQIRAKIATSVNLDIWINARFKVKNLNAIRKFRIKQLDPI